MILGAGDVLVIVVARRVAGPDYEVEGAFEVFVDPVEGCVDERDGGVAVRCLGAEFASWAVTSVACLFFAGGGVGFVEGVRVEVCWGLASCVFTKYWRTRFGSNYQ